MEKGWLHDVAGAPISFQLSASGVACACLCIVCPARGQKSWDLLLQLLLLAHFVTWFVVVVSDCNLIKKLFNVFLTLAASQNVILSHG